MLSVMRLRQYRLHWIGQTVALLGDQFHLIAMPWLVLQLTRDPLQLGLVLGVAGVSRAVFMLPGGALADRCTPRDIMIWTNVVRAFVAAALAVAVLGGGVQMWMVYLAAVAFGVITGIFEPASQAAVVHLVDAEELESGNSMVFLGDQMANFLGPAAAGALIGWLGTGAGERFAAGSLTGVGAAFAVHAALFAVSIGFLAKMKPMTPAAGTSHEHPLRSIAEGVRFVAARSHLVWMLVLMSAANLFLVGPLLVGVPVLADSRLAEGAAALGMVLSAYALGNLVGLIIAGSTRTPSPRVLGGLIIGLYAAFAMGLATFAWVTSTWTAVPVMALMGVGNGFLGVTIVTFLQRSTPQEMVGRMMSLMMVGMVGMMPVSQALSGVVVRAGVESLFLAAAAGMAVAGMVAATRPEVRSFGTVSLAEGAQAQADPGLHRTAA